MLSRPANPVRTAVPDVAPFPRPVGTFVGREEELGRVRELAEREVLFLVYGVGGIGKTELGYKAIEELRKREPWSSREPVLLRAEPRDRAEHLVARLRHRLGGKAGGRAGAESRATAEPGPHAALDAELRAAARALEAHPTLVLLDDLHELDPFEAGRMLAFLGRHVRKSRLFATSRIELPLGNDAPAAVVLRVAPLDPLATAEMAARLARRLGASCPDPRILYRKSGGSPFFVQRELSGETTLDPGGDAASLDRVLGTLDAGERHLLLLATLTAGRVGRDALARAATPAAPGRSAEATITGLARRFLLDVERDAVTVHDLVRDALHRRVDEAELCAARVTAARLLLARGPAPTPLDVIEAVRLYVAADAAEDAWALVRAQLVALGAVGLDHLLREELGALRARLPADRLAIDLVLARVLLRRSLVAEALEVLQRAARAPEGKRSVRLLLLRGSAWERLGQLARAAAIFRQARARARRPGERLQAAIELANLASLRGAGTEARRTLASVRDVAARRSPHDRARWGWALALSYLYEERYAEGAAVAAREARALEGAGADEVVDQLAMLELLSCVELDDVEGARRLLAEAALRADRAGADREHIVAVYRGVVRWAEGDLRAARESLEELARDFDAHGDRVLALLASHYLGWSLHGLGDPVSAARSFARLAQRSRATQLDSTALHNAAGQAAALLAAGDPLAAGRAARAVITGARAPVRARVQARGVLAQLAAQRGDLVVARRELERAVVELPAGEHDACRPALALERAEVELRGGDIELARTCAETALAHYAERGRLWPLTRARVALAQALVIRGAAPDLIQAEALLVLVRDAADPGGWTLLAARAALAQAGARVRAGDEAGGRTIVLDALRRLGALSGPPEVTLLRAALDGTRAAELEPGSRALLTSLGLAPGPRWEVVDQQGSRRGGADTMRGLLERDLVVDLVRTTIVAHGRLGTRGRRQLDGRPVACRLLARLIEAQPAPVPAEDLYRDVWGGLEYHTLRHRNTVYVGVNRLRRALAEVASGTELIVTTPDGWRIADGVDAAVVRRQGSDT